MPKQSRDGQTPASRQFQTRLRGTGVGQSELRIHTEGHRPSWLLGDQAEKEEI